MAFTLEDIVQRFGGEVVGDGSHRVGSLAPLDQAGPNNWRSSPIRNICRRSRRPARARC
jgi:hypothetical protein